MVTNATSVTETKRLNTTTLPNGEYKGIWVGYVVSVALGNGEYLFSTEDGISVIATKCVVKVDNGKVTVETI